MSVINLSNSGLKEHSVAVMTHFYAEGRKMGRRPTGVFFSIFYIKYTLRHVDASDITQGLIHFNGINV